MKKFAKALILVPLLPIVGVLFMLCIIGTLIGMMLGHKAVRIY